MTDDLDFDPGVQNDGEPVAVVPVPEPEPEPEEAPEPEVAETEEPEEEEKPHKKSGSQRWKEKAAREAQEKEYWKAQALQQKAPEPPQPVQQAPDGRPVSESFETYDEYLDALTDWKVEKKLAAQKAHQSWEAKAASARMKFEDFDDALDTAAEPSRAVREVLSESPLGGEVAYHLATHPEEYQRINRLGPVAAALELGRIEARLATPIEKPHKAPLTKAPKPPTPVSAAATAKPTDDGRIESY